MQINEIEMNKISINNKSPSIDNNLTQPVQTKVTIPTNDVSEEMREKIRKDLIETAYYNDVKYNIGSKSRWKCTADVTETLAHIIIAVGIMLAFAAGFFNIQMLSFISGSMNTASLVFLRFSSYAMRESRERTYQVNRLIEKLGYDDFPDIIVDSAGTNLGTGGQITDV